MTNSVHFDPAAGGDGTTITDDSNPTTGLGNYGWKTRFVPSLANVVAIARTVLARAADAWAYAANARLSSDGATAAAAAAAASSTAAAASAASAGAYASQAQATNPDSPMRLNPARITADFTVQTGYNAASVGPISISDGVTVTVGDNATWSIH